MSPPSPETLREDDLPVAFGRFTLTGLLGKGGMGRVFRAVLVGPSGFRKDVALKVISGGDREAIAEVRAGLGKEARIGALLSHPNIVDVYDFGDEEGLPWISMELVHGLDLQAMMAVTRLAPRHVVQLGVAIAAGLEHAHSLQIDDEPAGLVHRDLKPSNVLISRDGIVKVMDFGIAKLTSEGQHTATG
ncbi:MAG: serine/threonine protein kinase, partial [Deltaproteobacteria bacterium]|nr:serine/threonine protein kinase [Deltaproteobacteria bacterium]